MEFYTDDQTRKDLNIFPNKKGESSIFDFFNQTQTRGGMNELMGYLINPTKDFEIIISRQHAIKFFCDKNLQIKLRHSDLDFIDYYLKLNTTILKTNILDSLYTWIGNYIKPSNEYYIITEGLEYLHFHLRMLVNFIKNIPDEQLPDVLSKLKKEIEGFNKSLRGKEFLCPKKKRFSIVQVSRFDSLIRKKEKSRIQQIVKLSYSIDVLSSIANIAKDEDLCFPTLKQSELPQLDIQDLFHPLIHEPVKNSLKIGLNNNLCFITGANMAGKSTFLKAIALCLFLAHLGFPVPAKSMKSSIFNGLFSTINLSDNLQAGFSHYYSEVRRVKDIIQMIRKHKKIVVIFDELFRGTNVKDAFDATLLITQGFSQIKNSMFFISTHILEVCQKLTEQKGINFKSFNSNSVEGKPRYTYKITNGISEERIGLSIIKNEKIPELMDEIINQNSLQKKSTYSSNRRILQ